MQVNFPNGMSVEYDLPAKDLGPLVGVLADPDLWLTFLNSLFASFVVPQDADSVH
jgi:hypothetical protein